MNMQLIQLLQNLVIEYGPDQRLQHVLVHEIEKQERRLYLEAFAMDAQDMTLETLEHVAQDPNTPSDVLLVVKNELIQRPRRLSIQSALVERAYKREGRSTSLEENTKEFKEKLQMIIEVEETREESDIITLLAALDVRDDKLVKFDKTIIGITLGRVLATWKKPLRPYIASVRFSKHDTLSSLYHFRIMADKAVASARFDLVYGIMANFRNLVEQCTLQDLITLIRIHSMCKSVEPDIEQILRVRIESLCKSFPDAMRFLGLSEQEGISGDLHAVT
jgi:hypothetical protein